MIVEPDEKPNHSPEPVPGLLELIESLSRGDYKGDDFDLILLKLARDLHQRYMEIHRLDQITEHINAGLVLDEVLDNVYENFKEIIPYNRIGFALIDDDETVSAHWSRSEGLERHLLDDFSTSLENSDLLGVLRAHEPQILNDLISDLARHPANRPTELLVKEGIRSMMTCPLIANGVPIGFIFFSSTEPNVYEDRHVELFQKIASRLSIIVEKGRLVSEILEHEQSIESQNQELQHLNEMKNALLGMAVHDMRNPLNSIMMATQLMMDRDDLDDNNRWLLGAVNERSEYMLRLINDLLDVSNIEAGKLTIEPQPVELGRFLSISALELNHMYASKGTTIEVVSELNPTLSTDPYRLRQVVENLLSNAVKYSPAGSTVTVTLAPQGDEWKISVADQGPGISPQEHEKLFKPFARLSTKPTGDESSTGLGLAITRRVVEALGGEIGMQDNEPTGSVFWFTLPA